MGELVLFLLVVSSGVAAYAAIRRDPRINRRFVLRSLLDGLVFAAFLIAGLAASVFILGGPGGQNGVAWLLFVFSWIALAVIGFMRWGVSLNNAKQIARSRAMRTGVIIAAIIAFSSAFWMITHRGL